LVHWADDPFECDQALAAALEQYDFLTTTRTRTRRRRRRRF